MLAKIYILLFQYVFQTFVFSKDIMMDNIQVIPQIFK